MSLPCYLDVKRKDKPALYGMSTGIFCSASKTLRCWARAVPSKQDHIGNTKRGKDEELACAAFLVRMCGYSYNAVHHTASPERID